MTTTAATDRELREETSLTGAAIGVALGLLWSPWLALAALVLGAVVGWQWPPRRAPRVRSGDLVPTHADRWNATLFRVQASARFRNTYGRMPPCRW